MAKCKTCGKRIRIPKGWTIGPAVRRHYWASHPEVMERGRADLAAERSLPQRKRRASHPKGRRT